MPAYVEKSEPMLPHRQYTYRVELRTRVHTHVQSLVLPLSMEGCVGPWASLPRALHSLAQIFPLAGLVLSSSLVTSRYLSSHHANTHARTRPGLARSLRAQLVPLRLN